MTIPKNQYDPDYVVPPGLVLEERLDVQCMSRAEFARRCGRSPKLISEIISGKAPLEPETALQFEKVLGVDAGIWLGIESRYKLRRARQNEAREGIHAALQPVGHGAGQDGISVEFPLPDSGRKMGGRRGA